jgi:hypothetical protein
MFGFYPSNFAFFGMLKPQPVVSGCFRNVFQSQD